MKRVTSAAALYSIDHDRHYPANLRDLVPKYISEEHFVRGTRCWRDDSPHNIFIGRSEKRLPLVFCPIHLGEGPCASKVEFLKDALADTEPWKDLHKLDLERELLTCEPDFYLVNAYYPDFLWIQCTGDHPEYRPKTWLGPGHGDM